jgi:hypothetical protein
MISKERKRIGSQILDNNDKNLKGKKAQIPIGT